MNGVIIVGGVIKENGKYLLVQEAHERCRGKWNLPAGHLDLGETVFEGAKREVLEECGLKVQLTGIAHIGNRIMPRNEFIVIVFATKVVGGKIQIDNEEIMDAKWFTYSEILNMQDKLRSSDWIMNAINAVEFNDIAKLDIIKQVK